MYDKTDQHGPMSRHVPLPGTRFEAVAAGSADLSKSQPWDVLEVRPVAREETESLCSIAVAAISASAGRTPDSRRRRPARSATARPTGSSVRKRESDSPFFDYFDIGDIGDRGLIGEWVNATGGS